tara:strand:+ start:262 stop:495 length:234 start_codon:yes stop_codon:yes gene_type:complete
VKCLQSTRIGESGKDRVLLSQKSIKKEKMNSLMAKSASANMNSGQFSQGRSLIKDQFYVIKVVDVSEVPDNIANEAL